MENLNEGKKKKMSYMAELAEIDAQSAIVAMEAKINKLEEMAAAKEQRLSMVSEDENLSELISKSAVKEMQKEIKEIRKMQEKLEKLYEKKNGKKMPKMVDEVEELEEETVEEGGYDSTYEEDDMNEEIVSEEEIDEAHCATEEDDVNEEFLRMQKLAGVISEEEYKTQVDELFGFGKKKRASSGGGSKGHAVFAYEGGNKRRIGHGLTAKDARRDADWQRYRRNFNVDKFEVVNLDNDQVVDTMKG